MQRKGTLEHCRHRSSDNSFTTTDRPTFSNPSHLVRLSKCDCEARPPGLRVCIRKLWVKEVTKFRSERVGIDEIDDNSFVRTSHLLILLKAYLVTERMAQVGIISPRKPKPQ